MADQTERIILTAEDQTGPATKSANANIQSIEKSGASATQSLTTASEAQFTRIVAITDRTKQQIERTVQAIEKRVQAAKSPLDQLTAQHQLAQTKTAGNPEALAKVNQGFATLIANQKKFEMDQLLDKAVAASRRAERGINDFGGALAKLNKQKKLDYEDSLARAIKSSKDATKETDNFNNALLRLNKTQAKDRENQRAARDAVATNAERKLQAFETPIQRIQRTHSEDLTAVAGDPVAIQRVNAAYKQLIETEKQQDEQEKRLSRDAVVASLDKRVQALQGNTPANRLATLAAQKQVDLSKVHGDAAAIAKVEESYKLLNAAAAKTPGLIDSLSDTIRFRLGATTGGVFDNFAIKLSKTGVIMAGLIGVTAGMAFGAFELVKSMGKAAEETLNLGERLGITAGQAAILQAQARIAGTDVSSFTGLVRTLSSSLVDGGEKSREVVSGFEAVGVSVVDAGGKFRDPISLIRDFSKALDKFPDHARQVELMTKAFGKGSLEQFPLIKKFAELEEQAKATGAGLDTDIIKRLAAVDDKFDELGISFDRIKLKLAEHLVVFVDWVVNGKKVVGTDLPALAGAFVGAAVKKFSGPSGDVLGNLSSQVGDRFAPGGDLGDTIAGAPALKIPIPQVPSQFGVDVKNRDASVAAGDALVDKFRARTTLEGLQARLADLKIQEEKAASTIAHGARQDIIQAAIVSFDKVRRDAEGVQKLIEDMTEKKAKLKKLDDDLPKAKADLAASSSLTNDDKANKSVATIIKLQEEYGDAVKGNAVEQAKLNQLIDVSVKKDSLDRLHEESKLLSELSDKQHTAKFEAGVAFRNDSGKLAIDNINAIFAYQDKIAEQDRDSQLRALESFNAATLSQKILVEQAKASIEQDFLAKTSQNRLDALERERDSAVAEYEEDAKFKVNFGVISNEEYQTRLKSIDDKYDQAESENKISTDAAVNAARENANIKSNELILSRTKDIYDKFKSESEGIFDALLTKSQNVFQVIANTFKNIFLTAIKDIVSSRVAASLTQLVTGQKVHFEDDTVGRQGPLGKALSSLGLGKVPVFGNQQLNKSKLEAPNHLGDTILKNGAVPVYIALDHQGQSFNNAPSSLLGGFGSGSVGSFRLPGNGGGSRSSVNSSISFGEETGAPIPQAPFSGPSQRSTSAFPSFFSPGGLLGGFGSSSGGSFSLPGAGGGSSGGGFATQENVDFGEGPVSTGPAAVFGGFGNSNPASLIGPGGTTGFAPDASLFGGSSAGQGSGPFGGLSSLTSLFGSNPAGLIGPGGTPGFASGSLGLGGPTTATSGGGGFLGGLSGLLKSPLQSLTNIGNIGIDKGGLPGVNGQAGTDLGAGFGNSSAIGGAAGGALLAGGGILAYDGLRRGGIGGLLETTAGGAAIGAKFGGPVGALIGAAAGAIAGTIRLFIKGATQKVHDKVKSKYGVDIKDKGILNQIANEAKQRYGGNIDVAISSPDIRDMIELYALSTGQKANGIVAHAQASVQTNNRGVLSATPTYFDGQAVGPGGTQSAVGVPVRLPNGSYSTTSVPSTGANVTSAPRSDIVINIPGAQQFFQNETLRVVAGSPRTISGASAAGLSTGAGNRDTASSLLAGNSITA